MHAFISRGQLRRLLHLDSELALWPRDLQRCFLKLLCGRIQLLPTDGIEDEEGAGLRCWCRGDGSLHQCRGATARRTILPSTTQIQKNEEKTKMGCAHFGMCTSIIAGKPLKRPLLLP